MVDVRTATALSTRARRIPGHATPLVGRRFVLEQALQAVGRNFATVLWGPAGIGKSRLAHALAARWFDDRPDGDVWVVDLAAATDEATALAAISTAVSEGAPPADPAEMVRRMMARKRATLLVLDHCEHLADAVSGWSELWTCVGEGRLIATSRVAVEGAANFTVPALSEDDALRLIEQRARRVRDSFRIDGATRDDLRQLVRRVDALPGALELLAGRLMLLSPAELVERLDSGPGALHGAIERSWHLLDRNEQSVLAQLAATRGGFDVDLAERVVRCDGDTLKILEGLTRHAWLHVVESDGVRMQVLHEPMRFVRERGVDPAARDRHVEAMIELGERWDRDIESSDERSATRHLTDNLPNLWAAWEHAAADRRVRLALVLHMALQRCGSPERQDELTREAVTLASTAGEPALHGRALLARARVLRWNGLVGESRELLEAALPLGDASTRCGALRNLAAGAFAAGDLEASHGWAEQALEAATDAGSVIDEINARNGLGFWLSATGDLEAAEHQLRRALELASQAGRADGLFALVSSSLAGLAVRAGRWMDAEFHSSQALEVYERLGYQRQVPLERLYRAEARLASGRLDAATEDIAAAQAIARRWAYDSLALRGLYLQGVSEIARNNAVAAMEALAAAQTRLATREDANLSAEVAFAMATARLLAGEPDLAVKELEADDEDVRWLQIAATGPESSSHRASSPLRQICVDALQSRANALTIDAEGRGFRWSTGEHVDLTRRRALRGILEALASRHRSDPLTLAEVMEAGWPGEVMTVDSGNRRVYVTIKRLRDLGLGDALCTVGDGYMLDPDIPVLRRPSAA